MTEHAPTPWTCDKWNIYDSEGAIIFQNTRGGELRWVQDGTQILAETVRAVNSFEAMKEALENCVGRLKFRNYTGGDADAIEQGEEALALAAAEKMP